MNDHTTLSPETIYRLVTLNCADVIYLLDASGRIEWVNSAFVGRTGYGIEEMVGKRPGDLLSGPTTDQTTLAAARRAIAQRQNWVGELEFYSKQGTAFWVEHNLTPIFEDDGQHTHFLIISRDITARKHAERQTGEIMAAEQHRREERKLLSQVNEWLYAARNLEELLLVVRGSMETLMPETEGQLFIYSNSRDTLDCVTHWGHPDVADYAEIAMRRNVDADDCWALRRGRAYGYGRRAIEFPCAHVERTERPYFCLPITAHGETIGLLHLAFAGLDLSKNTTKDLQVFLESRWDLALQCSEQISLAVANVRLRQELLDQSIRDPLTNLWNRRWFLDAAHKALARAGEDESPVTFVSIDVDYFKRFNDHHGHDAGDIVLREVAKAMATHFEGHGAACRLGGEEFVALLPGIDKAEAMRLTDEYRQTIANTRVRYGGTTLPPITISAGIAAYPDDGARVLQIMRQADEALYAAKSGGRDRVVVYRASDGPNLATVSAS